MTQKIARRIITIALCMCVALAGFAIAGGGDSHAAVHKHSMTTYKAKAATCTSAGHTTYYKCKKCKLYFKDKAGTIKIAKNSWVISKKGHSLTKYSAKAATCTASGNKTYYKCTRCSKYYSTSTASKSIKKNSWVTKKLGHKLTKVSAKAATCTSNGNPKCYKCTRCGKFYKDSKAKSAATLTNALGHKYVEGKCTRCGASDPNYVPPGTGDNDNPFDPKDPPEDPKDPPTHEHEATLHSAVASTCQIPGHTAYYSCTCGSYYSDADCNNEIAANSWVLPVVDHSYGSDNYCIWCHKYKYEGSWTPVV